MAFSLYVSRSGVTTNLSDKNPFAFESLQEASSAPVVRFQQRGPLQHGVSDLGFRIQPRVLELSLLFYATTDAILDTYRQTLMDTFAPLTDISIFLYCQRDDGTTLRLTVFTVGEIEIDLVPENRPGHLHRATLKLRAANPLWVDTTLQSASYAGSAGTVSWWLAGGAISPSVVSSSGTMPTQGQQMALTGPGGTPLFEHTIAFRSGQESQAGVKYAYYLDHLGVGIGLRGDQYFGAGVTGYFLGYSQTDGTSFFQQTDDMGTVAMAAGTHNYFMRNFSAADAQFSRGTTLVWTHTLQTWPNGSAFWRGRASGSVSTYWVNDLTRYAIYAITLSDTQLAHLDHFMAGSAGFANISFAAVNNGDVAAYPVIKLTGPLSNITITNSTTGASFSLGTTVIGSADIYTIDLRDGDKQIYDANGDSKMASVTSPAALANFYLAPAPIAAGGTNTITVTGTATAATSRVAVEHYNQYMSF